MARATEAHTHKSELNQGGLEDSEAQKMHMHPSWHTSAFSCTHSGDLLAPSLPARALPMSHGTADDAPRATTRLRPCRPSPDDHGGEKPPGGGESSRAAPRPSTAGKQKTCSTS